MLVKGSQVKWPDCALQEDPAGGKVIKEMEDALQVWKDNKRWENLGILDQVKDTSLQWAY